MSQIIGKFHLKMFQITGKIHVIMFQITGNSKISNERFRYSSVNQTLLSNNVLA